MKDKSDIVKAWIRKAESDLINATNSINIKPKPPLDTVCFHAQQCAEKYLKAYLVQYEINFEKTHNLGELVLLAAKVDEDFQEIIDISERLTDYAVDIRYLFCWKNPQKKKQEKL